MIPLLMRFTWCYFIFLLFTFFIIQILLCGAEDNEYYDCSRNFTCGSTYVSYPFWGNGRQKYCGREGFELKCQEEKDGHPEYPFIEFENQIYLVLSINQSSHIMTIARSDLWVDYCLGRFAPFYDTTINYTVFDHVGDVSNLTIFYGCIEPNSEPMTNNMFLCPYDVNNHRTVGFFVNDSVPKEDLQSYISTCSVSIQVPVHKRALENLTSKTLQQALREGFSVGYLEDEGCSACRSSRGFCGTNISSPAFACYCQDKPYPSRCSHQGSNKVHRNIVIGVGAGLGALILVVAAVFFFYLRRNRRKYAPTSYTTTRGFSSTYSSRTDYEKDDCYGLPIFDHEELREATNNFDQNKEVGDGGFGTVYKGKLRDGRVVAIKRLYENNYKRKEQFLNEVEILARLRHPNLVILYGCTSPYSQSLLLVYEFISNGTVADHLHGDRVKPGSLSWFTRLNIAIETASALLYLHRSDVVHRDVKTYNILLDDNFSVKVADFGLSRLFPFNVTHVSTAPQGTPGYVDPEYHQCYQLTEKSDVYSFGVVLMELMSSLPAVDITRHRHEINLSTMAINKIQSGALHELVDKHLGFDCNDNIRRMITAVAELAFRCLQHAKEMRPCMEEVLETLKSIQNLDKPTNKAAEMDSLPDDAVLLKSEMIRSPDSVMVKLDSTLTTPNASG